MEAFAKIHPRFVRTSIVTIVCFVSTFLFLIESHRVFHLIGFHYNWKSTSKLDFTIVENLLLRIQLISFFNSSKSKLISLPKSIFFFVFFFFRTSELTEQYSILLPRSSNPCKRRNKCSVFEPARTVSESSRR